MTKITSEISQSPAGRSLFRNGEPGADYATAEAAFEVVAAKSSIEMRSDNEIVIHVGPADKSTDAPPNNL
jgi:hypothetical protein